MVKVKPAQTVYLVHEPRVHEHNGGDISEQVTVPDVAPSLYQMVHSSTVGSMPQNSHKYQYPDLGEDDDEAHDHPDYEKLDKLDAVEKSLYVDNWLTNPNLYEKKEEPRAIDAEGGAEGGKKAKDSTQES